MNWKKQLHDLEQAKAWDAAINFMEKFIQGHPYNMEAYLFLNYLLANMIREEQDWGIEDENRRNYITGLFKKYLVESYEKFSGNADYLFYMAKTCALVDWYFDQDIKNYKAMFEKAIALKPNNLFYKQVYIQHMWGGAPMREPRDIEFAKKVLTQDPSIKKIFDEKGALGKAIWSNLECSSRVVLGLPAFSYK